MVHTTKFTSPILPDHSQWVRLLRIGSFIAEEELQEDEDREKVVPLSCTLQVFELKSLPEYTALSYTCGKPVPDDLPEPYDKSEAIPFAEALHSPANDWIEPDWHIKVNKQRIHVSRNLRDALMRLASSHLGCWIRVYAICIDQQNLDEPSAQVQIMWTIYSNAAMVRAWLGEEDETAVETHLLQECLYTTILERLKHQAERAETEDVHPSQEKPVGTS